MVVEPGTRVKLSKIDPGYKGKEASEKEAVALVTRKRLKELFAECHPVKGSDAD